MCGIAGLITAPDAPSRADASVARAIAAALAHRGPDGAGESEGTFGLAGEAAAWRYALGHRRLAIIDTSPAGAQPLRSEDGAVEVVFNGEIYDHARHRAALQPAGHRFQSRTDGEVIVHLTEDARAAPLSVPRALRGMFAYAAVDRAAGRLVLARDRAGKKPLHYALEEDAAGRLRWLAFASEPAALFAAEAAGGPAVPRAIDRDALEQYLAVGYIPAPRTAFRAIRKLPPGCALVVEDGRARVERYARFADPAEHFNGSRILEASNDRPESPSASLRASVVDAVRARMESDVPLGAFLSGGIDSTIVTRILAREAQRIRGGRVATFSIGFDEPRWDETRYARIAAAACGSEHHERRLGPEALDALPAVVAAHGEPFADESALAVHHLAALAREGVTVALTGDGGDELLLGYRHHRAARALAALDAVAPAGLRAAVAALAGGLLAGGDEKTLRRQAARLLAALGADEAGRYVAWAGIFPARGGGIEALVRAASAHGARPGMTAIEQYDLDVYLPDDLLAKTDRATMAHGLEARAPLLDAPLAALAARIPARRKSPVPWRGKKILLDAFRDLVPEEIVRRPKMGFGVPVGPWMRGARRALVRDTLLAASPRCAAFVERGEIARMVEEHEAGRGGHARRLYALLVLENWLERLRPTM